MGSHGARRGDDTVWEAVRSGDVAAVDDHLKQHRKRAHRRKVSRHTRQLAASRGTHEEMWFEKHLGHRRRRRQSVAVIVSAKLADSTLHDPDAEEIEARLARGERIPATVQAAAASVAAAAVAAAAAADGSSAASSVTPSTMKNTSSVSAVSGGGGGGGRGNTATASGADPASSSSQRPRPSSAPGTGARTSRGRRGDTGRIRGLGTLFDHIFVRPLAPRETHLKYQRHKGLLPLLRSTSTAHGRGESNVATHMRNSTPLTRAYKKYYDSIDPNALLHSYSDRVHLRKLADAFLETEGQIKQHSVRVSKSRQLANHVTKALQTLREDTFSLSGPEMYQCFHSKYRPPKQSGAKRRRMNKRRRRGKAGRRRHAGILRYGTQEKQQEQ